MSPAEIGKAWSGKITRRAIAECVSLARRSLVDKHGPLRELSKLLTDPSHIAAERQRFDLPAFHQAHARDTFHLAAITASELLHSIERAADPRIKARRQRFVEGILADFAIIPCGLA